MYVKVYTVHIYLICKMNKLLMSFFQKNPLLSTAQHEFTHNCSTETALYEFYMIIVACLDCGRQVVGLFVDFSRAFDFVDHNLLT